MGPYLNILKRKIFTQHISFTHTMLLHFHYIMFIRRHCISYIFILNCWNSIIHFTPTLYSHSHSIKIFHIHVHTWIKLVTRIQESVENTELWKSYLTHCFSFYHFIDVSFVMSKVVCVVNFTTDEKKTAKVHKISIWNNFKRKLFTKVYGQFISKF